MTKARTLVGVAGTMLVAVLAACGGAEPECPAAATDEAPTTCSADGTCLISAESTPQSNDAPAPAKDPCGASNATVFTPGSGAPAQP